MEALEKQLDDGATEGIKLVNNAQDEGYTLNNGNGNTLVLKSVKVDENSAKPNLIKTHDEQISTAKTYPLQPFFIKGSEANDNKGEGIDIPSKGRDYKRINGTNEEQLHSDNLEKHLKCNKYDYISYRNGTLKRHVSSVH